LDNLFDFATIYTFNRGNKKDVTVGSVATVYFRILPNLKIKKLKKMSHKDYYEFGFGIAHLHNLPDSLLILNPFFEKS